jgi:hypothetical protein
MLGSNFCQAIRRIRFNFQFSNGRIKEQKQYKIVMLMLRKTVLNAGNKKVIHRLIG